MGAVAAPAIGAGVSYLGNKLTKTDDPYKTKGALNGFNGGPPSTGATGPLNALSSESAATGRTLTGTGLPYVTSGAGFYNTLVNGNISQLRSATTPERTQISNTYRGAERGLERSGLRGGSLDYAKADLARDRAAGLAAIVPGQRAAAASALINTGTGLVTAGQGATGQAIGGYSSLMSGANSAAALAENRRQFDTGESGKLGESLAPLLVSLLSKSGGKKGQSAASLGGTAGLLQ